MRGLVFTGNRTAEIREFPDPVPGPGEAVVAIRASGLCGSDLRRYRDETPADPVIIGHEPCGVIAALGAGGPPGLSVGDRVMVHHYAGCGVCEVCAAGFEQGCPRGRVTYGTGAHGSHADLMLVPSRSLAHLPDALSFQDGASIACGTGTAWNALRKMNVTGGDAVAVFGQGPVGLSGTLAAKAMGAQVIAIDVLPARLALARRLGADHVVDASASDPIEILREITGGAGVTAALESSGHPVARSQALQALRLFGRCAYVGMGKPALVDINLDIIRKNITVFGSWTFSKAEMIQCARFMVETGAPLAEIVTEHYHLDGAVDAYRAFDLGSSGKCMIVND